MAQMAISPDDHAIDSHKWTTGVAAINRGIRLKKIDVGIIFDDAASRRNDCHISSQFILALPRRASEQDTSQACNGSISSRSLTCTINPFPCAPFGRFYW